MTFQGACGVADPAMEIERLVYRYPGAREPVVRIASLRVERGERVVLTGASGSGKSTLLHLVSGLMDPTRGVVRVAGQDVHALRGPARDTFRGAHIGMVFQTHNLLGGFSAHENVLAALKFSQTPRREHDAHARALLGRLGIDRPSARVDTLSIGQQQRVAVARALACRPTIVLADEPTAALDPESAAAAIDLLEHACEGAGAALLCVTHDLSLVDRFDRHERLAVLHEREPSGVS